MKLTAQLRRVLAKEDPKLLAEEEAKEQRAMDAKYPEPELGDIEEKVVRLTTGYSTYWDLINKNRDLRFQRDITPEKWQRHLEQERRVRSRLGHNEVLRVAAMLTRNPYKFECAPAGSTEDARKRAEKQQRWANAFFPSMERQAQKKLRRLVVDAQVADGLGCWELYWTNSYEPLKDNLLKKRNVQGPDGESSQESDDAYLKRTEAELIEAGSPVGLRNIDPLSLLIEPGDNGPECGLVVEYKDYRQIWNKLVDTLGEEKLSEKRIPKPGSPGFATWMSSQADGPGMQNGNLRTIRYNDPNWYVYVVGTEVIESVRHGWGRCPLFPVPGIITSSPNFSEANQGITWGLSDLELVLNDLLTLGVDVSYTYNRPHLYIYTHPDGQLAQAPGASQPMVFDLSDPKRVRQLRPGQEVRDAFKDIAPKMDPQLTELFLNLWQKSGRNPAAQGSSPGSDVAGYTLNSLMTAADDQYGICLDNESMAASAIFDTVRHGIEAHLHERAYLTVKGVGDARQSVEWLGLGPDDIDSVPAKVTVDPTSEQNRLAKVQTLSSGVQQGVVPKRVLQEDGYGAEDPSEWNDEIVIEQVENRLAALLLDQELQLLSAPPPQGQLPPPSGLVDQNGQSIPSSQGQGVTPPPPNAPTVGAAQTAASQGGQSQQGGGGSLNGPIAGQNNGYAPPQGAESSGARGGGG